MDVLFQLQEAVLKNVAPPKPDELEKYRFNKMFPSSPYYEGNNELGLILFVGVAHTLGVSREEIEMFLSIGEEEYDFKLSRFNEKIETDHRFFNKVRLVDNYIKIKNNVKIR